MTCVIHSVFDLVSGSGQNTLKQSDWHKIESKFKLAMCINPIINVFIHCVDKPLLFFKFSLLNRLPFLREGRTLDAEFSDAEDVIAFEVA